MRTSALCSHFQFFPALAGGWPADCFVRGRVAVPGVAVFPALDFTLEVAELTDFFFVSDAPVLLRVVAMMKGSVAKEVVQAAFVLVLL